MKKILITAAISMAVASTFAAGKLSSDSQKAGYALGAQMGRQFKVQGVQVDNKSFIQGFNDAFSGKKMLMNDEQIKAAFAKLREQTIKNMQNKAKQQGAKNITAQKSFLAANAKKHGVVKLPSGLQYKVISSSKNLKAAKPTASDTVTVDYEGKLLDGTVFDSSYKRGTPATFPVGGVIKGWQQALKLMHVGDTWMLYIPSDLAYGATGAGASVPANAMLIFKVHLISIK
jgi:FKBP-type peptidyl-prolyl cis-trans isomerase FklB